MMGNILMDFHALRKKAEYMVKMFRQCGFKLIVFIDANVTRDKQNEWMRRRAGRLNTIASINDDLNRYCGSTKDFGHKWFAV